MILEIFSPNKEMNKFYLSQLIKKSKDLIKSRFDKFNIKVIEHIDDIEILSYQNELFQVILNLFQIQLMFYLQAK